MTQVEEAMRIIKGSKLFHFEHNDYGYSCVLVVQSYNTGKELRLDLSKLNNEMIEALEPEPKDETTE